MLNAHAKTILLVDDNDDARDLVGTVLRHDGYEVREAENGQDALDQLEAMAEPPCLLLLDMMMPVMGGEELLEILSKRHEYSSLPVVVLSAGGTPAQARKATVFMRKPTDIGTLRTIVRAICEP
jgi:CheY-like chemotaxis protein